MIIDYVVPYVNMADKEWQRIFRKYAHKNIANIVERYRDYGTLKYQFRGIDKFIPWIRNIYLVLQSPSQIPSWLNTKHPKLKIVYHKDFIPKEFLPTFNSSVLEMWYNRIPGISKYFLVSNDDMIPIKMLNAEDYFRNGKPVYPSRLLSNDDHLEKHRIWDHILFNSKKLSSQLAGKRRVFSYSCAHLLIPHTVDIWNEVWKKGKDCLLYGMRDSRTRKIKNHNHWLFKFYGILTGKAILDMNVPHKGYVLLKSKESFEKLENLVEVASVVCLNDGEYKGNDTKERIDNIIGKILPEKSSFEK